MTDILILKKLFTKYLHKKYNKLLSGAPNCNQNTEQNFFFIQRDFIKKFDKSKSQIAIIYY